MPRDDPIASSTWSSGDTQTLLHVYIYIFQCVVCDGMSFAGARFVDDDAKKSNLQAGRTLAFERFSYSTTKRKTSCKSHLRLVIKNFIYVCALSHN